ncbi:ABC transporter permease [Psychrobacillus sp. INOP01]|uniref:ABC transporter permease n=1 Tax=Psychrobacillus sp. INOP01 TaxID=2829187 RepID=UPI001BACCD75|nr:ABC transporter permease [Psychrobacillus sp. INOP01]QUG40167.1 ABC transporter permease [Psychrobacillus sp. INOP01]
MGLHKEPSVKFGFSDHLSYVFEKMMKRTSYKYLLLVLGFPLHLIIFFFYRLKRKNDTYFTIHKKINDSLKTAGLREKLLSEYKEQYVCKLDFFHEKVDEKQMNIEVDRLAQERYSKILVEKIEDEYEQQGLVKLNYISYFRSLLKKPVFLIVSFIPGVLMYILLFLFSNFFIKFIFERLVMSVFVIVGVSVLVFTILYLSPFDPAANLLGEAATKEQIASFNHTYGLDLPYLAQLWNAVKGIFTFDLGASFTGNEEVAASIANKFPITLTIAIFSLLMAIVIAIPVGIISATRQNTFLDYSFMFIALIGLSIPNFWQGLIFILNFSIKMQWLPATYNPQNMLSIIMPVIVLGTGLTASVARMTRSSMLEIINEDYIITAKAKGLNESQVLWKHAIGNAMIPIITVIGLLFGDMLGGAAVTEKVFNISGIGSYIVDKQFIPDIPAIMGGVIYIAITISLVNVLIDILYAFFDPRIRSKMKQL